ncbi:MAG: alpha/beta fold hydrolase [Nakamurella sp.]
MSAQLVQKSTSVRAKTYAFRVALGATELFAPAVGARIATRRWFAVPPHPAVRPLPAGRPFTVTAQHAAVRGVSFGDGPVVYLVHGWGGLGAQLGAFVKPLQDSGFRVVTFDAPAHGDSDPGPSGPGRSHGLEFGRALDAVAARFGPAHAVIAHSMGAVPALLAQLHGWLSADRLVFLAPMRDLATHFDRFAAQVGMGPRVRLGMTVQTERLVGYPVDGIDVLRLSRQLPPVPLLVVHDRRDRETSHDDSVRLVEQWAGPARLISTEGLGHRRLLLDAAVIRSVVGFVGPAVAESTIELSA